MVSVCFVCLGNICRSPTAEAVMRHLVQRAGLAAQIAVDSAGTGDWHAGEAPDRRSAAAARARGLELAGRARQFQPSDWERFDYVLAMDRDNLAALERSASSAQAAGKLFLLRAFDPASPPGASVPDPYFGDDGFDDVLDLCEAACAGLLEHLRATHGLS